MSVRPRNEDEPETSDGGAASSGEAAGRSRGRRAVIAAAAAAGAATVAGRAVPASAAPLSSGPVLLGKSNTETTTTAISNAKGTALSARTISHRHSAVAGTDDSHGGGYGVTGKSAHGYGVSGTSGGVSVTAGVIGTHTGAGHGSGVFGESASGTGITGITEGDGGTGAAGYDISAHGGYGVYAASDNGTALYVSGDANVTGSLSKGGGSFRIDHPLDPGRKYLYHSFVESPDMKNVYDGTVALDAAGRATVQLPEWFEALNRDFRYQLTPIGGAAPNLHIAAKVSDGHFAIAGGAAGQEVSWQVTGIRQDPWANAYRIPVEEAKPAEDQGRYLHPELHGGEPLTAIARARAGQHRGPRP
jgi:hypothetical protein